MKLLGAVIFLALLLVPSLAFGADGTTPSTDTAMHALHFAAEGIVGVYAFIATTQRAHQRDVATLKTQIARLQEQVKHVPEQETVSKLLGELHAANARMATLTDEFKRMNARFDRYEEHMIKAATK